MDWSYQEIAEIAGGHLAAGSGHAPSGPIRTDTRTMEEGATFLALRGMSHDGHAFVRAALARRARGLILSDARALPAGLAEVAVVIVADTLRALQLLARAARRRSAIRTAGITGSVGKTTTTAVAAAAVSAVATVTATRGNWNNLVGLPLSMLEIGPRTQVGLFEMGTNQSGEIAQLAAIAEPDAGIITAISPAHLEFLHSERGVFEEKACLLDALPPDGWAILPADSRWCASLRERAPGRVCTVGRSMQADLRWELGESLPDGWAVRFVDRQLGWEARGWVPGLAPHVGEAAGMALALVARWGYDPHAALDAIPSCRLPPMRMERREIAGVTWIDDSYNANPVSMRAALDVLANRPCSGRRILVVGDMLELGAASDRYHRQLGRWIRTRPFHAVFGCGDAIGRTLEQLDRPGSRARRAGPTAPDAAALIDTVLSYVRPGDLVLVKASHGIGLDRLVRAAREQEAVTAG